MNPVIEVHGVSKRYHIGSLKPEQRNLQSAIFDTVTQPFQRMRSMWRNQLPTDADREIWALKDVSFSVTPGETLGLIGVNGSGKSTLLKMIANIVKPTEGYIRTTGRIGSLLEASAGFHPELTGRENVFLKGAVHGMTAQEIEDRYDSIVAFSEIEEFMETPIKRYSSGMKVRLGFAVAAMMRPDIFLVDEAFAVGDAGFREKCMQEIEQIAREGRTVLVVSHSTGHILRLCDQVVWLEKGQMVASGPAEGIVAQYVDHVLRPQEIRRRLAREAAQKKEALEREREQADLEREEQTVQTASDETMTVRKPGYYQVPPNPASPMTLQSVSLKNAADEYVNVVDISAGFRIQISYQINEPVRGHLIVFVVTYPEKQRVLCIGDADSDPAFREIRNPGTYCAELEMPPMTLNVGEYALTVTLGIPYRIRYERHEVEVEFEVVDETTNRIEWYTGGQRPGLIGVDLPWQYNGRRPV